MAGIVVLGLPDAVLGQSTHTSPFPPPSTTDTTFITDFPEVGPDLDTPCWFRDAGRIDISFPIDPYVWEVDGRSGRKWTPTCAGITMTTPDR